MENEEVALAISEYLHGLDVCQPLAYYMARGLSIEIARVAVAAQPSVQSDKCPACDGKGWFGAQFCEGEECPTCEGTGICR